uniref:SPRY-associated domain-containing protein n=1 Tax=Oreochromis niloticus TaxID=8128 RepID=A0A669BZ36_ORENI
MEDSGVKMLSTILEGPHCQLETLRLSGCNLSWRSCETLSTVISTQSLNLKELDVSNNDLQDSGVQLLSAGLESHHCVLQTLRSGLHSTICYLFHFLICVIFKYLLPSFVRKFLASEKNNRLNFRLSGCQVTEQGCAALASALSSNPSHLRELDLSYNHPGDQGVTLLSLGLKDRQCQLETLRYEQKINSNAVRYYFSTNRRLKLCSAYRILYQLHGSSCK